MRESIAELKKVVWPTLNQLQQYFVVVLVFVLIMIAIDVYKRQVCGAVYAPTDLGNPYSALSGAKPELRSSEHFFFRLSDPRCVAFLEEWTQDGKLQPEVANKVKDCLLYTSRCV